MADARAGSFACAEASRRSRYPRAEPGPGPFLALAAAALAAESRGQTRATACAALPPRRRGLVETGSPRPRSALGRLGGHPPPRASGYAGLAAQRWIPCRRVRSRTSAACRGVPHTENYLAAEHASMESAGPGYAGVEPAR